MESGTVTTPFGRRPMSLAMMASQVKTRSIDAEKSVDKWKLYRALCEAKPRLGITDRALAVLNALLSFYPKNELREGRGLVVFPSNVQLSLRAHGMAEPTIRRHLATLIEAGLLIRKDSPNGKRYAHKARSGEIEEAFGFSLAPLLARSDEIEHLAAEIGAERRHLQRLRERLTLCRRDIAKLVEVALEQALDGDWATITHMAEMAVRALPRTPTVAQAADVLGELELLREEVSNRLESQLKLAKLSGNPVHNERHIQNSKSDSIFESEPGFDTKLGAKTEIDDIRPIKTMAPINDQTAVAPENSVPIYHRDLKSFPLGLVMQACPTIADYGPGGKITTWRDLMSAAVVVRTMLGVSPSAYEDACAAMGPENAATVLSCILERGGHINSAGGYLRDLTRKAERGEFGLGPMLMALLRSNGQTISRAV